VTEAHIVRALRVATALFALVLVGALGSGSPASAASSCPTQTFLRFDHLAYAAKSIPSTVAVSPGSAVGPGTIDEATSSNGCKRADHPVRVLSVGSIAPQVAVLVDGRPHTIFVIGQRCAGFTGSAYWDCLLRPLVFNGLQFTATSYPSAPAPRRTVPLGPAIGTAEYHDQKVTVRRIQGVDPSLAVGISGQPSAAFLSPHTCPYSGFSSTPQYDNLLRCLRSPVWFTFDPLAGQVGGTVVGRSDRPLSPAVVGASISLVQLPVAADLVPPNHGPLTVDDRVAEQVNIKVPNLSPGLYEAVVSCPRCSSGTTGGSLYPAGSFLVTGKPKTSVGILIVSYGLLVAVLVAAALAFRTLRRRRGLRSPLAALRPLESFMLGPGRGKEGWGADAPARPPARHGPPPSAQHGPAPSADSSTTSADQTPSTKRRRKSGRRRRNS
jgi:hypothetical protein